MKTTIAVCIFFFVSISLSAQTRTLYILITEEKGNSWSCPSQQVAYDVYQLSKKLSYTNKQKALNVFKERLKGGNDKTIIKDYSVSIKQKDYLVFYEYIYRYSEKKGDKCKTNTRRIIKGFPASSLDEIDEKLENKLTTNIYKDKYISHKILEIRQPFVSEEAGYLEKFKQYIRKKYPNGKPSKSLGVGVRG